MIGGEKERRKGGEEKRRGWEQERECGRMGCGVGVGRGGDERKRNGGQRVQG